MTIRLYGLTEFAAVLGKGWDRRKISVYYKRGKLPEPEFLAGNGRPIWTEKQVLEYKEKINKEK